MFNLIYFELIGGGEFLCVSFPDVKNGPQKSATIIASRAAASLWKRLIGFSRSEFCCTIDRLSDPRFQSGRHRKFDDGEVRE